MITKLEGTKKKYITSLELKRKLTHTTGPLTLCIQETPKRVLLQTVKAQMKCSIMLHDAAFHQGLHCKRKKDLQAK